MAASIETGFLKLRAANWIPCREAVVLEGSHAYLGGFSSNWRLSTAYVLGDIAPTAKELDTLQESRGTGGFTCALGRVLIL